MRIPRSARVWHSRSHDCASAISALSSISARSCGDFTCGCPLKASAFVLCPLQCSNSACARFQFLSIARAAFSCVSGPMSSRSARASVKYASWFASFHVPSFCPPQETQHAGPPPPRFAFPRCTCASKAAPSRPARQSQTRRLRWRPARLRLAREQSHAPLCDQCAPRFPFLSALPRRKSESARVVPRTLPPLHRKRVASGERAQGAISARDSGAPHVALSHIGRVPLHTRRTLAARNAQPMKHAAFTRGQVRGDCPRFARVRCALRLDTRESIRESAARIHSRDCERVQCGAFHWRQVRRETVSACAYRLRFSVPARLRETCAHGKRALPFPHEQHAALGKYALGGERECVRRVPLHFSVCTRRDSLRTRRASRFRLSRVSIVTLSAHAPRFQLRAFAMGSARDKRALLPNLGD